MWALLGNKWVLAGVAGLALAGAAAAQTWRLGNAQETIGEYREKVRSQAAAIDAAAAANETQTATIRQLRDRIAEMVESRRVEAERREAELTERDRELARARAEAADLRREIDDAFDATYSCATLRDLRVDTACPAVADRLRERTRYQGGDGDRDG